MAEAALRWVRCRLVAGHGVASGRAATSPYPAGTIHLQAPYFAARGIDLSPFFAGTLNLEAARGHWRLRDPDARVEALEWTDRHPPETFSFWHCRLRVPAEAAAAVGSAGLAALIYYPHPETKRAHHQAPSCLELLAPWIAGLHPGVELELGVDPRRFGDYAGRGFLIEKNEEAYAKVFTVHYPDEERSAARPLKRTPCYDRMKDLGAVFGSVYGWERPGR